MGQPLKIFAGMFQPKSYFERIYYSEEITGFWWRLILLLLASGFINALYVYFGVGTEEIMSQMDQIVPNKLEWAQLLFGVGAAIGGFLYPVFIILFFSLFLFIFFREVSFQTLIYLQLSIVPIFLIEKLVYLLYFFLFGIDQQYSPFGLGPIIQMLITNEFFIYFMGSITLFNLWAVIIQCIALKIFTERKTSIIILIVIAIHLLFILITTIVAAILDRFPITF